MTTSPGPRDWRIERDGENIAWLTFDKHASSTNTLSAAALDELRDVLSGLVSDPPKGLVLIRSGN